MSKLLTLLVLFSFIGPILAAETQEQIQKQMASPAVKKPLINEIVPVKAIPDHHFNLEAPQDCGPQATPSLSAKQVSCQFHSSGPKKITVSVCDDAKKYCKQEYLKVDVLPKKSGTPRIKADLSGSTKKMQSQTKKILMNGFKAISPEKAKELSGNKKPIMVMVSTEWCPPCNMAKEFLLPTSNFNNTTKDFVRVYVDGDGPLIADWRPHLKSFYYPSFLILNPQMKTVGLKIGFSYEADFSKWIVSSTENIDKPMTALKRTLDNRIAKNWLQNIKDYFVTDAVKATDEKRWLDYLREREENAEAIRYMKAFSASKYENEIARANYKSTWFGKNSGALSKEEEKKALQKIAKVIVKKPMRTDKKKDWLYKRIMLSNCQNYGKPPKDSDSNMTDRECDRAFEEIIKAQNKTRENAWNKLTAVEKIIEKSEAFKEQAEIHKAKHNKKETLASYKNCLSELDKLVEHTPLKEQSRAISFKRLSCLHKDMSEQNEKLLLSMIKAYPYDSTFHNQLASFKMKNKKYNEALEANALALKYSYGDYWAKTIIQRAKILKAMKKNKKALSLIETALGEVVLAKDGKKMWWLKSMRAEHKDLQKKVNKTL